MGRDRALQRYRRLYALLLRLYPAAFRRRFARPMEQTFHDLCRERRAAGRGPWIFVLGLFAETFVGILRERTAQVMPPRKNLLRVMLVTAALLAVPLVAMRFTDDVNWSVADFVVAAAVLLGAGLGFELVARRARSHAYRLATALAFGAALLLIWINLAVGLIGSADNPANGLYLGVLLVAILGGLIARLRPRKMSRALYLTALAQALVPVIAFLLWRPLDPGGAGVVGVFLLNAGFVVLFLGSGILFGAAADAEPERG